MNIQTAGEQKYYNYIEAQVKKLRTGMIVWGSLLAVALIGMFSEEEQIIITKDYVLLGKDKVNIYLLSEMEKVEVGLQGKMGKALFLTDRQGKRHEILACVKGDGKQEDFDRAYSTMNERVR